MAKKPAKKTPVAKVAKPLLAHHSAIPEPLSLLHTAGFDEDVDLLLDVTDSEDPDEVRAMIDALVLMALDQTYYSYSNGTEDEVPDVRCFTPLNAIRALCYLADDAGHVIPSILPLFASEDDNLREELPLLFACLQEFSYELLINLLLDESADVNLRDGAAESLVQMVELDADIAQPVQEVLVKALTTCEDMELSTYLVLDLMDLGDAAAVPFIEHAFMEQRIDTEIIALADVLKHFESLAVFDVPDEEIGLLDVGSEDETLTTADENEDGEEEKRTPFVAEAKPGRNDLCPCGSGLKYKKCHGK